MANLVSQVCLCSARVTLCQERNLGALANGNFNLIELDHFMRPGLMYSRCLLG